MLNSPKTPIELCTLGFNYLYGLGVNEDKKQAFDYFKLAADQGDVEAQYQTSIFFIGYREINADFEKEKHYLLLAVDKGYVPAMHALSRHYELGERQWGENLKEALALYEKYNKTVVKNPNYQWQLSPALSRYKRELELDELCSKGRGYEIGECGYPHDPNKAKEYFQQAADAGHAQGQYLLGLMYNGNSGIGKDIGKKISYLTLAAQQNYQSALNALGRHYEPNDFVESLKWYMQAITTDPVKLSIEKLKNEGYVYLEGRAYEKSSIRSLAYYQTAADQGDADAQYQTFRFYLGNHDIPANSYKANYYLQLASNQKHPQAMFTLSKNYAEQGIELKQALKLYEEAVKNDSFLAQQKAPENLLRFRKKQEQEKKQEQLNQLIENADKGDEDAQYNLALLYLEGEGVTKDLPKASDYLHNTAAQGHALALQKLTETADNGNKDAQFNLALLYLYGKGVGLDLEKAVDYLGKAAKQNHTQALTELPNAQARLNAKILLINALNNESTSKPPLGEHKNSWFVETREQNEKGNDNSDDPLLKNADITSQYAYLGQ